MLASHKNVISSMKQISDGQIAIIKGHEAAALLSGDAKRSLYLKQMEMLCCQQRLLACQLHDSLQAQMAIP